IWPFPDAAVKKYLGDKKAIIVPELNEGQLSIELKRVMGGIWNYDIRKTKHIVEIQKTNGTLIKPAEILNVIKEVK
nr:2-oxoacid:acceptor oxidoreductase subunit alpha [Candidatus Cloacimonadota bacterium]